jgi:hypothetical protein
MGFFGNLLGQAVGGGLGGLFGGKGRDIGSTIGGYGGSLLPFAGGGRLMPFKRGGRLRVVGSMPQMCMGGKMCSSQKGSRAMKRKMAKLRAMKK